MKKARLHLALLAVAGGLFSAALSAQPIGVIDEPTAGQHVSGIVKVSGWVLDLNRVDRIDLFIDGNSLPTNTAVINLPRPDVLNAFPNYAGTVSAAPGYVTSFYTHNFADGTHSVVVQVTQSDGTVFNLGPVSVIVDNTINQAPFGYIDIPSEAVTENASGSYPIVGWALDDTGVDHIDFLVDSQIVAGAVGRLDQHENNPQPENASYGTTRPDVAAAFPDVPFAYLTGFVANVDTTKLIDGIHVISVRVTDIDGVSAVIGTRTVQVTNNASTLFPFGRIDFPLDKASLNCQPPVVFVNPGTCPSPCFPPSPTGEIVPVSFYSNFVQGWALDTSARLDKGQVAFVELLLDGAIISNTRNDCVKLGTALLNCYGVNRPDVARSYSGYVNADNAGFNFAFALSHDNSTGLLDIFIPATVGGRELVGYTNSGKHTIALRVGDDNDTVTQIAAMSVDILCDFSVINPDHPSFGFVDTPYEEQFIKGLFRISGWAYDFDLGVTSVDIDIDGQVVANLNVPSGTYGLRRDDVPANDIRVPHPFVGFMYPMDTTTMSDTEHDLAVYAYDGFGRRSEVGRRKFVVLNNSAIKEDKNSAAIQ